MKTSWEELENRIQDLLYPKSIDSYISYQRDIRLEKGILDLIRAVVKEEKTALFTQAEINHILSLMLDNERAGWYTGNSKQWWARHARIAAKLADLEKDSKK